MFRKENGVTLVALVITIIVLLILAGVTISMVLGEEGMIARASQTTVAQKSAEVRDHVSMALASIRMEDIAHLAKLDGADAVDPRDTELQTRVKTYLGTVGYEASDVDDTTDNTVVVSVVDGQDNPWEITVTMEEDEGNYSITDVTYSEAQE